MNRIAVARRPEHRIVVRGHVVYAPVEVIRLGAAETEVETFHADGIDHLPPSMLDETVPDMRDLPDRGIDVLLRRGDRVVKRLLQDPGDIAAAPAAGDDLVVVEPAFVGCVVAADAVLEDDLGARDVAERRCPGPGARSAVVAARDKIGHVGAASDGRAGVVSQRDQRAIAPLVILEDDMRDGLHFDTPIILPRAMWMSYRFLPPRPSSAPSQSSAALAAAAAMACGSRGLSFRPRSIDARSLRSFSSLRSAYLFRAA